MNRRCASLQSLFVVIEQSHLVSGRETVVCNAGTHGAGAENGNCVYGSDVCLFADAWHLADSALGKEGMTQAARLGRILALHERFAFGLQSLLEIDLGRHLDQVDDLLR